MNYISSKATFRNRRISDLGNVETLEHRHAPDKIEVGRIERSDDLQTCKTLYLGIRNITVECPGCCDMHSLVARSFLGEQDTLADHPAGIMQFDRSIAIGSALVGLKGE